MKGLKQIVGISKNKKDDPKDRKPPEEASLTNVNSPSVILELETNKEKTSDEFLNFADDFRDGNQCVERIGNASKKLAGANKQLISVGKHLSGVVSDSNLAKQLAALVENLAVWNETLTVETKKFTPSPDDTTIKVWTIKKFVKVTKFIANCVAFVIAGLKSASSSASADDTQRQVNFLSSFHFHLHICLLFFFLKTTLHAHQ
jgi:hypothetical protein